MESRARRAAPENAWWPCGCVLTPLAAPGRSTPGAMLFSATAALPAPSGALKGHSPPLEDCRFAEAENCSGIGMLICEIRH